MLNDAGMSFLVSQLGFQVPQMIVYLVGFALALSYMNRAPRPSILTLLGTGLLMSNLVGSAMARAVLLSSLQGNREIGWLMSLTGIVSCCLSGIGLGLLVAAIFVDRNSSVPAEDRYLHE